MGNFWPAEKQSVFCRNRLYSRFLGQTACRLTSYFIYFLGRIMRDYTTQKTSFFTRQSNHQHALQVVRFPLPIKHKVF